MIFFVTKDGYENLSKDILREVEEIEAFMRENNVHVKKQIEVVYEIMIGKDAQVERLFIFGSFERRYSSKSICQFIKSIIFQMSMYMVDHARMKMGEYDLGMSRIRQR